MSTNTLAYPAMLDALHTRAVRDRLVASPTGQVLASRERLPDAPESSLDRLGMAVADAGPDSAFGEGRAADRFAIGLLEIHRELLRQVLSQAISHLAGRTSAGSSLLSMQLLEGQLADVALAINTDDAVPSGVRDADRRSRWRSHLRLVAAGRQLVKFFGASGYLADGPGADLYLAEVTGNVYLHPDLEDDDD
jgi:hypothetical protein